MIKKVSTVLSLYVLSKVQKIVSANLGKEVQVSKMLSIPSLTVL